jgi:hypothetical protein
VLQALSEREFTFTHAVGRAWILSMMTKNNRSLVPAPPSPEQAERQFRGAQDGALNLRRD